MKQTNESVSTLIMSVNGYTKLVEKRGCHRDAPQRSSLKFKLDARIENHISSSSVSPSKSALVVFAFSWGPSVRSCPCVEL